MQQIAMLFYNILHNLRLNIQKNRLRGRIRLLYLPRSVRYFKFKAIAQKSNAQVYPLGQQGHGDKELLAAFLFSDIGVFALNS